MVYGVKNGEDNFIIISNHNSELIVQYHSNGEVKSNRLINLDEKFSKNNASNRQYFLFQYMNEFPFLRDIAKIFNYVYLPLERTYKLDEYYNSEFASFYPLYRFNELDNLKKRSFSMIQITNLIANRYNRTNRDISFIDNEFRNKILKSFSEIYSTKDPNELFDIIFDEIEKEKIINQALKIKKDDKLAKCLGKAKEKLDKQEAEAAYANEMNKAKSLIVDKKLDEAKHVLSSLQKKYPERKEEIKKLFTQIFNLESAKNFFDDKEKEEEDVALKPVRVTGFKPDSRPKIKQQPPPDFFDNPRGQQKKPAVAKPGPKKDENVRTGDDFFDSDTWRVKRKDTGGNFDF